ncbi:MAG TPA: hypothetical protein VGI70_13915, partial [Polyangiales bacterium]
GAILHGHLHRRFHLALPELPVPIFGAGSTTGGDHGGLWLFDVDRTRARAAPGAWRDRAYVIDDASAIAF